MGSSYIKLFVLDGVWHWHHTLLQSVPDILETRIFNMASIYHYLSPEGVLGSEKSKKKIKGCPKKNKFWKKNQKFFPPKNT